MLRQGRRPLLDHVIFCKLGSCAGPQFPLLCQTGSEALARKGWGTTRGALGTLPGGGWGAGGGDTGTTNPSAARAGPTLPPCSRGGAPAGRAATGARASVEHVLAPGSGGVRQGPGPGRPPVRGHRVRKREARGPAGGRSRCGRWAPCVHLASRPARKSLGWGWRWGLPCLKERMPRYGFVNSFTP